MCVYYLFIAHFLTGHYLAKLFIPLKTINPFPRNDIAQCIIGFSRSLLSETIDWIHFIPLSIIWWWRETNRNQPRVSNNSTKTVKKQKKWMFNVARKKWTFSVPGEEVIDWHLLHVWGPLIQRVRPLKPCYTWWHAPQQFTLRTTCVLSRYNRVNKNPHQVHVLM